MERVHCPRHSERTASCVIYPEYAYCYGGCGRIELSELGISPDQAPKERYVENLQETLSYIDQLQRKPVRGFLFPFDDNGYYLVWPDRNYYKRRNWEDGGNKYKNPAGHAQPPFWVSRSGHKTLAICEGEINALSVSVAFPEWDVVSPGSASEFKTEKTRHFLLTYCTSYCTIILVTDYDGPGIGATITVESILLGRVPQIKKALMGQDANEVLCEKGTYELRKTIEASLR